MTRSALFLDRDGVINVDHGYVFEARNFTFIPGVFDLARFFVHELGWPVVVVTNQSGIGRGLFDEPAYQRITNWMCERFAAENAPLARVYHCPYHPQHGIGEYRRDHPWRKPAPGMILQAASDLGLDLAASVLIGDSPRDIEAGRAAGVGLLIRFHPAGVPPADGTPPAHHVIADLSEAVSVLRMRAGARAPRA